jgi:beta-glucosidase
MTDTALTVAATEFAADDGLSRADLRTAGEAAQRASITVLTNRALRTGWADPDPRPMLPLARGLKLYIEGIAAAVAAEYGELVDTPEEADAAILRLQEPAELRETTFDDLMHAGSPDFAPEVLDHVRAVAAAVPTIVDVFADRPANLEPIVDVAAAVILNVGASAAALLDVVTGAAEPQGRLPFDLPRSKATGAASRPDVPVGTANPLFRFGHGLSL